MAAKNGSRTQFWKAINRVAIDFPMDRGAEARESQRLQPELWAGLIRNKVREVLPDEFPMALDAIATMVETYIRNNMAELESVESKYVMKARFPLLKLDELQAIDDFAKIGPWEALAAVLNRLWFIIASDANNRHRLTQDDILAMTSDPRLTGATANFFALLRREELEGGPQFDRAEKVAAAIEQRGAKAAAELAESRLYLEDFVKKATAEAARAETANEERSKSFDEFIVKARGDIEAARKQATEAGILQSATKLWHDKAWGHGIRFWAGLLLIVGAVGYGIHFTYQNAPDLLKRLPTKPDGEVTYVAVALLTICAIAAGWLLRFFGRFATENMVMQTDAAQRRVMLQTYLALVGDKDAKMEQTDRTLILNAIFRPLPGHQSEDIAPPTLSEVIKSAATGGKSG